MSFTFVHTADWQIGKGFGSMPSDKAPLLREARLAAIDRIARVARAEDARHVLVAGDIYDAPDVSDRDLMQALDRLRREEGLTWHLLPGNHDPAQSGGVWDRLARIGAPGNVMVHAEPRAVMITTDVALLTAPLTGRSTAADPTAWMVGAATPLATHRIGLAHGSIQGFGGEQGEASVPIEPGRAEAAGLDYLALGDWHGLTRISERAWYSGTPEPDRFHDNEPGHVLVVRLQGSGRPPRVERHATAHYAWWKRTLDLSLPAGLELLEQALTDVAYQERLLLRLRIIGNASLSAWAASEARRAAIEPRLFHLEVDGAGLRVLPDEVELEELGAGDLRRVADMLSRTARDTEDRRASAAALALRKLYLMWREVRAGARS